MRRRTMVAGLSGALAPLPFEVSAQPKATPVVGFMSTRGPDESARQTAAFRQGLNAAGFVEGRTVAVEYRWTRGRYEDLPALASELVSRGVTVIAALGGAPSALAAKAATTVIPTVFLIGDDPVKVGLVSSFNRPGGNLTGVSFFAGELGSKRLGLLCELLPNTSVMALLLNPDNPGAERHRQDVQKAADTLGRRLLVQYAKAPAEFERNFATLTAEKVGGLVMENDPFFDSQRDRLIALAARHAIPAIYHIPEFPTAGGLMSYGANLTAAYRAVGALVGQILHGAKPADIPIVRPTTLELVVNVKTAKTLGLTVPTLLLARADELIE